LSLVHALLATAADALRLPRSALDHVHVDGEGELPSAFAVTDFATASIGAAAVALRELAGEVSGERAPLRLDRRLAALWFDRSLVPSGWAVDGLWDAIAGDYATRDGWIRLHTNAPHHRRAALAVLGCAGDRAAVARAVGAWSSDELEAAVVSHGGCAASMRSIEAWRAHPQGRAVAAEPLVDWLAAPGAPQSPPVWHGWRPRPDRPLAGLRVLDLTRVIAGPVATRTLAGYGTEVLRIDPPEWDEPAILPESTLGKTCARLDLREAADRRVFERLLAEADLLVHGYRPQALEALGWSRATRLWLNPGLVEVTLDAYGWTGPWAGRRGFDSLVQMSAGIAERGMRWKSAARPVPLPVQALDHATGYLMAAAAIRAIADRAAGAAPGCARLSLARTAWFLIDAAGTAQAGAPVAVEARDVRPELEATAWGPGRRLGNAAAVGTIAQRWTRPAGRLGAAAPTWPQA